MGSESGKYRVRTIRYLRHFNSYLSSKCERDIFTLPESERPLPMKPSVVAAVAPLLEHPSPVPLPPRCRVVMRCCCLPARRPSPRRPCPRPFPICRSPLLTHRRKEMRLSSPLLSSSLPPLPIIIDPTHSLPHSPSFLQLLCFFRPRPPSLPSLPSTHSS